MIARRRIPGDSASGRRLKSWLVVRLKSWCSQKFHNFEIGIEVYALSIGAE